MFRKKTRKSERQWALEVRSRSKLLQAVRLKMAAGALAISTGVVLTLFVCWKGGEYLLNRCVYTNPNLSVQRLEVQTDGIIPLARIRAWASVKPGQNLLSLDLARIKRDLELIPMIESASVERILPRDLIVRVREREPIARVTVFAPQHGGALVEPIYLFLDEQGMVIPPVLRSLNPGAFEVATRYLPVITGVGTNSFRPGHIVQSARVTAALQWIRAFRDSEMIGQVELRAVDISSDTALLVSTEHGNEVSFSYRGFDSQIARWRRIHQVFGTGAQTIATLDLAVTNYVPVVLTERTNAAPAAIRGAEPSPYRKKHV